MIRRKMILSDLGSIKEAPKDWSEVFDYEEDLIKLKSKLDDLGKFERIIVIGNGGSITSYDAYLLALRPEIKSQTVWTMDPAYLNAVKESFPNDGKTIVVAVSKSGNTLGQIESLLYFDKYPAVVVTNPESGALSEIAKRLNWKIITHPSVGGRFSGATASALTPAYLAKMDIESIKTGIKSGYAMKNEAYSLALFYYNLEQDGYNEVYINCYTQPLAGFGNLIVQLMHESVCKDGKGQTFYFAMGPEAQHHTNQRFLGGRKNVIGTFILAKKDFSNLKQSVSEKLKDVHFREETLGILDGISFQDALEAEYLGTKKDSDQNQIPNVTLTLDDVNPESVGSFLSFWHLVAFYSAKLRGGDPFNQPAVENSKNITLDILKNKE